MRETKRTKKYVEKTEEENVRNEAFNMIFTCKTAKIFYFFSPQEVL